MLVLKLKLGESVHIGDDIHVMLLRACDSSCRIGIEAPTNLEILRDVLLQRKLAAEACCDEGEIDEEIESDLGGEG